MLSSRDGHEAQYFALDRVCTDASRTQGRRNGRLDSIEVKLIVIIGKR